MLNVVNLMRQYQHGTLKFTRYEACIVARNILYSPGTEIDPQTKLPVFINNKPYKVKCMIAINRCYVEPYMYMIQADEQTRKIIGGTCLRVKSEEEMIEEVKRLLEKYNFVKNDYAQLLLEGTL